MARIGTGQIIGRKFRNILRMHHGIELCIQGERPPVKARSVQGESTTAAADARTGAMVAERLEL